MKIEVKEKIGELRNLLKDMEREDELGFIKWECDQQSDEIMTETYVCQFADELVDRRIAEVEEGQDMKFIVASHNAMPALLDELERLDKLVNEVERLARMTAAACKDK